MPNELTEFGTPNARNSVFIALFVKDLRPYKDNHEVTPLIKELIMSKMLMIHRWDGLIGFPGGNVDAGDGSFIDALRREMQQEINFDINPNRIIPTVSHNISDGHNVHLYRAEISVAEMWKIRRNGHTGEHSESEVNGIMFTQILDMALNNMYNSNGLAPVVKEEMAAVIELEDLMPKNPGVDVFKLHDFGTRGGVSMEAHVAAGIGPMELMSP